MTPVSQSYFGRPDALYESKDRIYGQLFRDSEGFLKLPDTPEGAFFITGVKGIGKTALRRSVEMLLEKRNFPVKSFDRNQAFIEKLEISNKTYYRHYFINALLIKVLNAVISDRRFWTRERVNTCLGPIIQKIKEVFRGMIDSSSINLGIGPIRLDFSGNRPQGPLFSEVSINDYLEHLRPLFKRTPFFVMIDDFDSFFANADTNSSIRDAAFDAVYEINMAFEKLLTVLAFPKAQLSLAYQKDSNDPDWSYGKFFWIKWETPFLMRLLKLRVGDIHNVASRNKKNTMNLEFHHDDIGRIEEFLTKYVHNGPRDVIELCNRAKMIADKSGRSIVNFEDFKRVLADFRSNKLDILESSFKRIFPKIRIIVNALCEELLRKGSAVDDGLMRGALLALRERTDIRNIRWFINKDTIKLMRDLYTAGIIGTSKGGDSQMVYYLNNPDLDYSRGNYYGIHPVFCAVQKSEV